MAISASSYNKIPNQIKNIEEYNQRFATDRPIQKIPISLLIKAPDEYNVFSKMKSDPVKMLEMKFSIYNNGLFNPIIVWKEPQGSNYMILSGHTRTSLYKDIYTELKLANDPKSNEFESIPAIVYEYSELTEDKAREIIIDTNYIQRDMDKRVLPLVVQCRADIVRKQKNRQGKTLDLVAKDLKISRTSAYENLVLSTKVIDELASYYYEGYIRKKNIIKFAYFDRLTQFKIYEECRSYFSNERIALLKKGMDFNTIKNTLITEIEHKDEVVEVKFKVKASQMDDFKEAVLALMKEKGFTE